MIPLAPPPRARERAELQTNCCSISATPSSPATTDDYKLVYSSQNRTVDIPVTGSTVDIVIERGDYGSNNDCFEQHTPPGFVLRVVTFPNTDPSPNDKYEDVILRMLDSPQAPWIEDDTTDNFAIGWNNVARFIIEDGA